MIYFNRPESVLLDRIEKTKRDKLCLSRSKDFKDLLINRQNKIFEEPSCKEADLFFEINDEKSLKETESKILKLIKN
jgi:thymidylate kinase